MTDAATGSPNRIKHGLGWLLLGGVLFALGVGMGAVNRASPDLDAQGTITSALAMMFGWAGVACIVAAVVLLIRGLLRD